MNRDLDLDLLNLAPPKMVQEHEGIPVVDSRLLAKMFYGDAPKGHAMILEGIRKTEEDIKHVEVFLNSPDEGIKEDPHFIYSEEVYGFGGMQKRDYVYLTEIGFLKALRHFRGSVPTLWYHRLINEFTEMKRQTKALPALVPSANPIIEAIEKARETRQKTLNEVIDRFKDLDFIVSAIGDVVADKMIAATVRTPAVIEAPEEPEESEEAVEEYEKAKRYKSFVNRIKTKGKWDPFSFRQSVLKTGGFEATADRLGVDVRTVKKWAEPDSKGPLWQYKDLVIYKMIEKNGKKKAVYSASTLRGFFSLKK